MDDLQWARETFAQDLFATQATGIEILDAAKGYAKCQLTVKPIHKNAKHTVMGGAIFTLADFAFAIAANVGNDPTVTLSSQITFLAPATGDLLTAEARCIKDGKSTCYYEVEVRDERNKLIAKATANGFKLP